MFKRDAEEHYFGSMVELASASKLHQESTIIGGILKAREIKIEEVSRATMHVRKSNMQPLMLHSLDKSHNTSCSPRNIQNQ